MLVIITFTIFLIVFGNVIISKIVTDPIKRLEASLKDIEEGALDAEQVYIGGSHEIRHLGRTIKSLVVQMRNIMDERVKEQKEKRMEVGKGARMTETELDGPEMVKLPVQLLLLNREQDAGIISKIKSILAEWKL